MCFNGDLLNCHYVPFMVLNDAVDLGSSRCIFYPGIRPEKQAFKKGKGCQERFQKIPLSGISKTNP